MLAYAVRGLNKPMGVSQYGLTGAHDLAAIRVLAEGALARAHGATRARVVGQFAVAVLHKPLRRLDQHAVAHGEDGGDAFFEPARDGDAV